MEYGAGLGAMLRTRYPSGFPPKGQPLGRVYGPSPLIHWAKIGFEKWWLWRWF